MALIMRIILCVLTACFVLVVKWLSGSIIVAIGFALFVAVVCVTLVNDVIAILEKKIAALQTQIDDLKRELEEMKRKE